jgi:hypothetical protein
MTLAELQSVKDTMKTWSGIGVDPLAEMENRIKSVLEIDTFSKDK